MRNSHPILALAALAAVSGSPLPQAGPFRTRNEQFTVDGLIAGGSQDAVIYWPLDATEAAAAAAPVRNVVAFAHGLRAGGEHMDPAYHPLLATLASYGLIVIAPLSCPHDFCAKQLGLDLGTTLEACAANRTLHPALAGANFTRVGVAGHSMGGAASGYVASAANATSAYRVHAYVGMHGTPVLQESTIAVPTMYTTGAKDHLVLASVVQRSFERSTGAHPRVFAELSDADHFEPTANFSGHLRLNPYVAAFLLCHVAGDGASCANVYDTTDANSLCNAYPGKMVQPDGACQIVQ